MKKLLPLFLVFSLFLTPLQALANFEEVDSSGVELGLDSDVYDNNDDVHITFNEYSFDEFDLSQLDLSEYDVEINESTRFIEYNITENESDGIQQAASGVVVVTATWVNRNNSTVPFQCTNVGTATLQNILIYIEGFNDMGKKVFTGSVDQKSLVAGNSFKETKTLPGSKTVEFTPSCVVNGSVYIGDIGLLN